MKYFTIIMVLSLIFLKPLYSQEGQKVGLNGAQIAQKSFAIAKPNSLRMKVLIQLINPKSRKARVRHIEVIQEESAKSRKFIEFISPQDVAGTKFISSERANITETRMFSPGDGKIRVITSSSKKNSFMGTDLSYYDLESHNYEDFHYTLQSSGQKIKDKSFAGMSFYVVEAIPKDRAAPYDKMLYWIEDDYFQARRIEAFVNNIKVKDIYMLKNIEGIGYIIPKVILAINHQKNGHRTIWAVQEQELNPNIEERVFSLQNLR